MNQDLTKVPPFERAALEQVFDLFQDDLTSEELKDTLQTTNAGDIKNCLTNAVEILSNDLLLRDALKYNEMTQHIDVVRKLPWERKSSSLPLTDFDVESIQLYIEETYELFSSKKLIEEAIDIVATRRKYHPVRDYLNSLKWDGNERIRYALHKFLGADTSDYTCEALKLFMIGAISRVFTPGIKFDNTLVLVGAQGAGKSSFFRLLSVNDDWFSDDLRDLESNSVFEKLQGHWIIELSEMLATNNAKSTEAIKSFLSRQKESYRTPYAQHSEDRPRQCVFAGTTNKVSFLPNDRSGNRRFLPVACNEKEAEVFILDDEKSSREYISQMWAEAMDLYKKGKYQLSLSPALEDAAKASQKAFMQEDVNSGLILSYMKECSEEKVCSAYLLKYALNNPSPNPARWEYTEVNEIMNTLIANGDLVGWRYFSNPKRFKEFGTQRGWEKVPSSVNESVSTADHYRCQGN